MPDKGTEKSKLRTYDDDLPPLDKDVIKAIVVEEIEDAKELWRSQSEQRTKNWERYLRQPLGNEVEGRSSIVTSDVLDTIEWMMPTFVQTFMSGDDKVIVVPEGHNDYTGSKGMAALLKRQIFEDNSGFLLCYSWFKESFLTNLGSVKSSWKSDWHEKIYSLGDISPEQMDILDRDQDIEVLNADPLQDDAFMGDFVGYENVKVLVRRKIFEGVFVDPVPSDEVFVDPQCRITGDKFGKGHRTYVRLNDLRVWDRWNRDRFGEPLFPHLDDFEFQMLSMESELDSERILRTPEERDALVREFADKGARKKVEIWEWYTQIDLNRDGFLEDVVVWMGSYQGSGDKSVSEVIGWKENFDGFSISNITPIIIPNRFYGESFASLLTEIQDLRTLILRAILDNVAFQVEGRWRVSPSAVACIPNLLAGGTNTAVIAEKGAVESLSAKPFDYRVFNLLEYLQAERENKTGITRYNQGMDADSLNKTATGILRIQSSAMQRMELVCQIFAETGFKTLYTNNIRLNQRYQDREQEVVVDGEPYILTLDTIRKPWRVKTNIGVDTIFHQRETQALTMILKMAMDVGEKIPGLFGQEQIYNIIKKIIFLSGYQDVDQFIQKPMPGDMIGTVPGGLLGGVNAVVPGANRPTQSGGPRPNGPGPAHGQGVPRAGGPGSTGTVIQPRPGLLVRPAGTGMQGSALIPGPGMQGQGGRPSNVLAMRGRA